MNPADSWWGVGGSSGTTKREQLAFSNYMHELHPSIERHHVGATLPRLCSPRLLIVRWLRSDTAKTVPAVPAAPALTVEAFVSSRVTSCSPTGCSGSVVYFQINRLSSVGAFTIQEYWFRKLRRYVYRWFEWLILNNNHKWCKVCWLLRLPSDHKFLDL